jgi:hypothetical protein
VRRFGAPEFLARLAVETDGEELLVLHAGQEDAVAVNHGRGKAGGQRRLPGDVLLGPDLGGQNAVADGDGSAALAAEMGPIAGEVVAGRCHQEQGKQ